MDLSFNRLNQYRIMWVFVFFDLPVQTKQERRQYTLFRKHLLTNGFTKIQYSIYARHCMSNEAADVHTKRVKKALPPKGEVIIFRLTDKQFGMMEYFFGPKMTHRPDTPQQLELF